MPQSMRAKEVEAVVERIRKKMRPWGITVTFLAMQLGVSRQYVWQIVHSHTFLSLNKVLEIERVVDSIIAQQKHMKTFGDRLRAARISAGLTLKQVAKVIGYTWVGVERWEKNICLPKPGVLWHLCSVYGITQDWLAAKRLEAAKNPTNPAHLTNRFEPRVSVHAELTEASRFNAGLVHADGIGQQPQYLYAMSYPENLRKRAKSSTKR